MSKIKLTSRKTKNEFRKAFTDNFEYIYIRIKAEKAGQTKLSDANSFLADSEVSVDKNLTVAEFEKDATTKTGMQVSIYYETKLEDGKSKFYLARKKYAETTLGELDKKATQLKNIVSQKEYMDKLVNGKKTIDEKSNNVGTLIKWYDEEYYSFSMYHNDLVPTIIKYFGEYYNLLSVKIKVEDNENLISYTSDIKSFIPDYDEEDDEAYGVEYYFELEEDYLTPTQIAKQLLDILDKDLGYENFRIYIEVNNDGKEWVYGINEYERFFLPYEAWCEL